MAPSRPCTVQGIWLRTPARPQSKLFAVAWLQPAALLKLPQYAAYDLQREILQRYHQAPKKLYEETQTSPKATTFQDQPHCPILVIRVDSARLLCNLAAAGSQKCRVGYSDVFSKKCEATTRCNAARWTNNSLDFARVCGCSLDSKFWNPQKPGSQLDCLASGSSPDCEGQSPSTRVNARKGP